MPAVTVTIGGILDVEEIIYKQSQFYFIHCFRIDLVRKFQVINEVIIECNVFILRVIQILFSDVLAEQASLKIRESFPGELTTADPGWRQNNGCVLVRCIIVFVENRVIFILVNAQVRFAFQLNLV